MYDNYAITKFEKWILKRIAKRIVIQSHLHEKNVIEYYKIINDACNDEFTEDNRITLDSFLEDCHKESIKLRKYI